MGSQQPSYGAGSSSGGSQMIGGSVGGGMMDAGYAS